MQPSDDAEGEVRADDTDALEELLHVLPGHVLHDHERHAAVLAQGVDVDHVLVPDRRQQARLAAEQRRLTGVHGVLGKQHFDRDLTLQRQILGEVDGAHGTAA